MRGVAREVLEETFGKPRESIRLDGVELKMVDAFKYLRSTLSADDSEDKEITGIIQTGWKSWRDVSRVLCDRKMTVKLRGEGVLNCCKTSDDVRGGGSTCEENKRGGGSS